MHTEQNDLKKIIRNNSRLLQSDGLHKLEK